MTDINEFKNWINDKRNQAIDDVEPYTVLAMDLIAKVLLDFMFYGDL